MTDFWDRYGKPIPILQWLVVIVLSAHVLVSPEAALTTSEMQARQPGSSLWTAQNHLLGCHLDHPRHR